MINDIEIVSLKVLKILYDYYMKNTNSGLSCEGLVEQIGYSDQAEGLKTVKDALTELRKLGMVSRRQEETLVYIISKVGIKHYERFKYMKEDDEVKNSSPNIIIYGGVDNIDNRQDCHHHHYHMSSNEMTFPGDKEEFFEYHDDLKETFDEIVSLAQDASNGSEILGKIEELKTIISLNSSALGGWKKVDRSVEKLAKLLEKKLDK